ncbi:MAG: translesion DNA synthesis-associated protein ImuA, partial [Xanthomonadales bacterium]|nr:translesion DNA synthesis-associated protein ImuA [Xanthomonadales bacterium]
MSRAAGDKLDAILAGTPRLWKGRRRNQAQDVLATGHAALDRHLPGGGWPRGAVTELVTARPGLGELSLLFPALAAAGGPGCWLLLIDPPWIPYPASLYGHGLCLERLLLIRTPGAGESLWACEQALRGMPQGIVLAWPRDIRFAALRRLQLAAEDQGGTAFLFRPESAAAAAKVLGCQPAEIML